MADDRYIRDKDKNQLLNGLLNGPDVGSRAYEQMRMGIFVRCTEDLEKAIKNFTDSNNKLSHRILWLNIILGLFTVAGGVIAVAQVIKPLLTS